MDTLETPATFEPYWMREPCRKCTNQRGLRVDRGGQACIYCAVCGQFAYNAPKSETGEPQRSVRTRPDIKPSQRRRIFDRDGSRCVFCNTDDTKLHVGHLLSVDDGHRLGVPDNELFSDENLAVMCEECNLGFGKFTAGLPLIARILHVRYLRNHGHS